MWRPAIRSTSRAAHTVQSIKEIGLPPGYSYRFSGQVKVLEETTWNLLLAMLLASIFMYMVLAAQFESFSYPFIIMLTLPLSIPFALFSLWITGRALSLWSALGMFLLLGIVKKNGILQVDYTNRLRAAGMPVREAILEANRVRLRPILMTTLSIVAGLIPVAIGIGAGSEQRASIAVTIIGGQTLCLLLTLLIVPVAYSYLAEFETAPWVTSSRSLWPHQWLGRRFRRGLTSRSNSPHCVSVATFSEMAGSQASEHGVVLLQNGIRETARGSAQQKKKFSGPQKNVQQPAALQIVDVLAVQSRVESPPGALFNECSQSREV